MKARTPITAAAAETMPPDRRAAPPSNMTPWETEADAEEEGEAFCSAETPVGIILPMLLDGVAWEKAPYEAGVAMGT